MDSLIKQYISKININNINDFALKNNIFLNKKELECLYDIVKNRYEEVLYKDDSNVLKYLKENLSEENYEKVIKLYQEYRLKFGNYLLWFITSSNRFLLNFLFFIISISSL